MWILRRLLGQVFARPTAPPEPEQAEQDSARAIERIRALITQRSLDQALVLAREILEREPERVDMLVLSGEILRRLRRVEEAKLAYQRALAPLDHRW